MINSETSLIIGWLGGLIEVDYVIDSDDRQLLTQTEASINVDRVESTTSKMSAYHACAR